MSRVLLSLIVTFILVLCLVGEVVADAGASSPTVGAGSDTFPKNDSISNHENETVPAPVGPGSPDRQNSYAIGTGLTFPDFLTVEGWWFYNNRLGLRAFYTPPIPVSVMVEHPEDKETIKSRLKVATPATDVKITGRYLANYGLEAFYFPFSYPLFMTSGISYRKISLRGDGSSPLIVCLVTHEMPCDKEHETFPSHSDLDFTVDLTSTALLYRFSAGWMWEYSNQLTIMLTALGLAWPTHITRTIDVDTAIVSELEVEGVDKNEIIQAMESYVDKKKPSLKKRVTSRWDEYEDVLLPIMGISVFWRF